MLYNQFVQMHSNQAAAAATSDTLQSPATASLPKGSPNSGETTGEQPLDLSAKPMGPFGHDGKMAFR